jgi:hypothetical protein
LGADADVATCADAGAGSAAAAADAATSAIAAGSIPMGVVAAAAASAADDGGASAQEFGPFPSGSHPDRLLLLSLLLLMMMLMLPLPLRMGPRGQRYQTVLLSGLLLLRVCASVHVRVDLLLACFSIARFYHFVSNVCGLRTREWHVPRHAECQEAATDAGPGHTTAQITTTRYMRTTHRYRTLASGAISCWPHTQNKCSRPLTTKNTFFTFLQWW